MYKLVPNNKDAGNFHLSAFHWPIILEQCGMYFVAISHKTRWFYVAGVDKRMGESEEGPAIIFNSGFPVTEEEARVLARVSRNYAIIQRSATKEEAPWLDLLKPQLIYEIEDFAEWAEKSRGFEVW